MTGARIEKCGLPAESLLHDYVRPGDFLDGLACDSRLDVDTAVTRAMAIPGWVGGLLRLRDMAVRPFGLRPASPADDAATPFPIDRRNRDEVILGFDDTRLNFRISILCTGTRAHSATWVHCNNRLGHAYLAMIKPFHILIMRNAMRQVANARFAI